jgi:hypothetical protein
LEEGYEKPEFCSDRDMVVGSFGLRRTA